MALVWRSLPWLVAIALAAVAAAALAAPIEAMFVHVPLNYNEGWNAFHALRLRSGGPLYPPLGEAVFINYPPLSFYLVAALHPLFGDDIFAGRALALAAELVVTVNIVLAARALRIGWPLAVLTGLVFFAFVALFFNDAVAIDDPQWLGHALQSSGLVLLLRTRRRDWPTLIGVALLCLAGGLVKQSLVALPLAITLWLALDDRRALRRWLVAGAGLLALALGALVIAYGGGFVDQVLRSERGLWLAALVFVGRTLAIRILPYLLFAAAGLWLARAERGARLVAAYLAVALPAGIGLLAVDGVGYSALFDATIAMLLGAALLFRAFAERLATLRAIPTLAALVFALPVLLSAPEAPAVHADLSRALAHRDAWQASIDSIAAADGPVACEMLALCYWAGRQSAVEFFNFGQYAGLHPAFADALTARIEARALALIQEDGQSGSRRLPARVDAAIAANYAPIQWAPTTLLAPAAPAAEPTGSR